MTVRDLIETLSTLPPEATVMVGDWNEAYAPPAPLVDMMYYEATQSVVLADPDIRGLGPTLRTATETHTTTFCGCTAAIRANWAEASSPVETNWDGNGWVPTGQQVADYSHRPAAAMRALLTDPGDDGEIDQAAVDAAVDAMTKQ